jgi:purine nucleosidase
VRYIVDCDTGIDDAVALVSLIRLLRGEPDSRLIGVTASYGNVTMDTSVRNSLAVLALFGASDVPVYPGVEHALGMRSFEVSPGVSFIHGRNGLGGQRIPDSSRKPEQMHAAEFMARAAKKYGQDLTIIATGAFTNLADALRLRPQMAQEVSRIVLMGTALAVPGSVNQWTEANVGQDPEAARQVLQSGANLLVVGRDVTTTTLLTRRQTQAWARSGTDRGAFLAGMLDWYIHTYEINFSGLPGCYISDPTAVVLAVHPELATLCLHRRLTALTGGPACGRTLVDVSYHQGTDPRTSVVLEIDNDKFMTLLLGALSAAVA